MPENQQCSKELRNDEEIIRRELHKAIDAMCYADAGINEALNCQRIKMLMALWLDKTGGLSTMELLNACC